jgi:uncharacterized protein YkwD
MGISTLGRRASMTMLVAMLVVASVIASATAATALTSSERRLRHELLAATNRSRLHRNVHRVHLSFRVSRDIYAHTRAMARRHRLFHSRHPKRYLRGINWHLWGENIAVTRASIRRMQRMFMHSSAHRANVLNPRFHRVGIGVVGQAGKLWATVFFFG